LLKTIEEPPADSLIILVTGRPESLLPTIRSRCQSIRFAPLAIDTVEATIRRVRGLPDTDARFVAMVSGGRLGFALEADPQALRAERAEFLRLMSVDSLTSIGSLFEICEAVGKSDQAEASLGWLAAWFRDLIVLKAGGGRHRLLNADCLTELDELASRLSLERVLDLAAYVESMERGLERNLNKQLMLEGLLLRLRAALQRKAA
jgi:DNA polymerase-3 subunit delta'